MRELEPKQTFNCRTWRIETWDDQEEITIRSKRNGAGITGMVGPLYERDYPKLFKDNPSQQDVDKSARQLIREMISGSNEYGFEECWSDGFPIKRFFPVKDFRNTAEFFAELLRNYLKPSGPDGIVQPGDITQAAQDCLRDLINPNIMVVFKPVSPTFRGGPLGSLWKEGENSWRVQVTKGGNEEMTETEGHEAGHLMVEYFLKTEK